LYFFLGIKYTDNSIPKKNQQSMTGGLMQLVAYGSQDVYLTGKSQVTYFKSLYKRHTNFAMESIEQNFNGTADFGKKVSATISRNGDLIYRTTLQVKLPDVVVPAGSKFRWLNHLGHVLIANCSISIGGQQIDKHYGEWLHIWNELTQTSGHKEGYANMIGNVPRLTQLYAPATTGSSITVPGTTLYIPFKFWFCDNPGLALPLIALQYHEVKIDIEFRDIKSCCYMTGSVNVPSLSAVTLYVDYIYLDVDERRRFAQMSHEYLIEQLQFAGDESVSNTSIRSRQSLNHPVKSLTWVVQKDDVVDYAQSQNFGGQQWFNFTDAVDYSYYSGTPADPLGGGMTSTMGNDTLPIFADGIGSGASTKAYDASGVNWAIDANGGSTIRNNLNTDIPFYDVGENPVVQAKIQLNGSDRFSPRDGRYFNLLQPYYHHTNCPATGINVYSFALRPEDNQPSGTCNMSRIDNCTLQLQLTSKLSSGKLRVYARNYNVLRIMSGMGGLAYSD
jgi:hypothetical protein